MSIFSSNKRPSERSFGILVTIIFLALSIYGIFSGWRTIFVATYVAASASSSLATIFLPRLFSPFNTAWFQLGQFLGRIVSPIVLGFIFFALITPIAFVTRLFGRDELLLKRRPVSTYWVDRTPPGPEPDSFRNQF